MTRPLHILVAHNVPNTRTGGMSRIMSFVHDQVERDGDLFSPTLSLRQKLPDIRALAAA